jgi:hypothetical protein
MKHLMHKANIALLGIAFSLTIAITALNVRTVIAADAPPSDWVTPESGNGTNCEDVIDMTSTCPTGFTASYPQRFTACKTGEPPAFVEPFCCEYRGWVKICYKNNPPSWSNAGYIEGLSGIYSNLKCGGPAGTVCQPDDQR